MPYYVSTVCKTLANWQPVLPSTTLGPFATPEGACNAANAYQDNARRARALVECSIFGDGPDEQQERAELARLKAKYEPQ